MRVAWARVVALVAAVSMSAAAGCSGEPADAGSGGQGTSATTGGGSTPSATGERSTSASTPIAGGTHVTDGAAAFDLPPDVDLVEAPARVVDGTAQRTWRFAPNPDDARCVITLTQQPRYTKPFPENERQVLRARVEQLEGGHVDVDDSGAGPSGAPAGWLTHHTTPPDAAAGRAQTHSVWSRMFVTDRHGLVTLAAAATNDSAHACQIEAVVRSLSWTGEQVDDATDTPSHA